MKTDEMSWIKKIFIIPLVLGGLAVVPSRAANNGCGEDGNDYITSELALCSTHAYNVNLTQNPKSNEPEKQEMDNVIAMKTTVITQQLYKQYSMMESMLARFKTQLEKAVLTSNMAAAGAKDEEESTGYTSNDKFMVLSGTANCQLRRAEGKDAAIKCLQNNINHVISAANAGNTTDARKQLKKDIESAQSIISSRVNCNKLAEKDEVNTEICNNNCNKIYENKGKKDEVLSCSYWLIGQLSDELDSMKKEEMKLRQSQPSWSY